jgi:hypothetical protein
MTATAGYLFEGADWDFSKLQDERSTSAKDDFFISTSRSAYYTTVLPYCILLTRTVVLLGNINSSSNLSWVALKIAGGGF